MKVYIVRRKVLIIETIQVFAETAEEAKEKSWDKERIGTELDKFVFSVDDAKERSK